MPVIFIESSVSCVSMDPSVDVAEYELLYDMGLNVLTLEHTFTVFK
ncbi:hypothetical protein DSOL_0320 [Desulfosporosinus metallidurans]|uniref:Uncharacterized protein n=1 Tax=Desulfosporosinus metallidurans TaxID=1888891 RepID=A0A1Q8R2D7_9FIRM|nr:hypothetical protein DSOL_0320 [Desulfosporosinus metallidurans]